MTYTATKTSSAEHWHRHWVIQDPEFLNIVKQLPPFRLDAIPPFNEYKKIGKLYKIPESLVGMVHGDYSAVYDPLFPSVDNGMVFNPRNQRITALLSPRITYAQFHHLWKEVVEIKKKEGFSTLKKSKPPERSQILYAIFRARCSGMTFKEIYIAYTNQGLPYYPHKENRIFSDDLKLKRYYERYYLPVPNTSLK